MRFVFALFAALAAAAPLSAGVQVEFTSTPEAAGVFIDGRLRGSTPLVLRGAELEVGRRHHLRFSKEGYEDVDMFFAARDGDRFVQHAELVPQKGLLLVTTEPEGAEISRDGYSLGTTPRLVTSLNAKDVHTLVIRKAGYQDRKLEVRFNGRRPLVRNVSLVLDSGVLKIGSSPAGAEVTVNGISRGPAPVTVTGIPKGRVALSVRKEGYKPFTREISVNAGDEQDIFAELVPLPGALAITSVPEGARVYVDGEFRGKSPVSVADLSPRQYRVKVELDGFYAQEAMLDVGIGKTVKREYRLVSNLGSLEIRTTPPDAIVTVDGRMCGTTTASAPNATTSDVLVVGGLKAGEHTLIVRKYRYAEVVQHPVVAVSKATTVNVKMARKFTPNVEIVMTTGEVIKGELVSRDEKMYTVMVSLTQPRTIPCDSVKTVKPIAEKQ